MGRSKTLKFADNEANRNVVQPGKDFFDHCKGRWHDSFFGNQNPIVLELACGRGEYTIGLAREFPDKNFIGVDIKGARIWNGSTLASREQLNNAAFLRIHIQNLEQFFEGGEVSEIWIVHPDPRPKKSDMHRRLTHPRFLEIYKRLVENNGLVHLKTDNEGLFEYTLEVLDARKDITHLEVTYNLYDSSLLPEHYGIRTRYEEQFVSEGHDIRYLRFRFDTDNQVKK